MAAPTCMGDTRHPTELRYGQQGASEERGLHVLMSSSSGEQQDQRAQDPHAGECPAVERVDEGAIGLEEQRSGHGGGEHETNAAATGGVGGRERLVAGPARAAMAPTGGGAAGVAYGREDQGAQAEKR